MKYIFLTIIFGLAASSLGYSEEYFGFHTTDYSKVLLVPWIVDEHPYTYGGVYSGEYGDGGGTLEVIPYPTKMVGDRHIFRYSGVLITATVASRPKITVFEHRVIEKGLLKSHNVQARFFIFKHPDGRKIKGILIDDLFYSKQENS